MITLGPFMSNRLDRSVRATLARPTRIGCRALSSPAMSHPQRTTHNPSSLAPAIGFSHAIATTGGRVVWLAGQNGTDGAGHIVAPGDLVAQTDLALSNLLTALAAAGGQPEDIVQLRLYVSDLVDYRARRGELGPIWRRHFGRYYPTMTLLGVAGFFDPEALVEVDGVAVVFGAMAAPSGAAEA
jgi:enamine deaminase RidA (YjgF/YER057c/UK114 family)